jgi:hypothetical protein
MYWRVFLSNAMIMLNTHDDKNGFIKQTKNF